MHSPPAARRAIQKIVMLKVHKHGNSVIQMNINEQTFSPTDPPGDHTLPPPSPSPEKKTTQTINNSLVILTKEFSSACSGGNEAQLNFNLGP
jgi:hypothetical protein